MERGCAVQPWIERVDGVDMVLVGCGGWRAEGVQGGSMDWGRLPP